jgi:small GTP-binding protein
VWVGLLVAHVDHGKSTLADRLLEVAGTIDKSASNAQFLDKLEVERKRGITVKAQTASMFHQHDDGKKYLLNLIDTPGHVDFNYEVACSLAACQGTLLVVDAAQGVQAQTVANFFLAFERGLTIIPVLNKVHLAFSDPIRIVWSLNIPLALRHIFILV